MWWYEMSTSCHAKRVILSSIIIISSSDSRSMLHPILSFRCVQTTDGLHKLPAQPFWSSDLLCCRSDSLELATGQSPWRSAQQQQFQTIAEDESVSSIPLSTHSTVEMLHDSALYKSIIDIDNYLLGLGSCRYQAMRSYIRRVFDAWRLQRLSEHLSQVYPATCQSNTVNVLNCTAHPQ